MELHYEACGGIEMIKDKIMGLELVIFDLDGTSIDSNGIRNMIDVEVVRSFWGRKN